jgi:hypothetical protein
VAGIEERLDTGPPLRGVRAPTRGFRKRRRGQSVRQSERQHLEIAGAVEVRQVAPRVPATPMCGVEPEARAPGKPMFNALFPK